MEPVWLMLSQDSFGFCGNWQMAVKNMISVEIFHMWVILFGGHKQIFKIAY